jgi:hypothetical protein
LKIKRIKKLPFALLLFDMEVLGLELFEDKLLVACLIGDALVFVTVVADV